MSYGKTIQVFLPDGNPRSVKVAEITSQTLSALLIPRAKLDLANKREELRQCGVYLLFGTTDDETKPLVYIGEAEDISVRLRQHNKSKDFWSTAVAIVSKTQHLTKTHVKYLEWLSFQEAQNAGRFSTDNSNVPSRPYVSEPMEADLRDNFETIQLLISTLGYPVFDAIKRPQKKKLVYCKGRDSDAKGEYTEDGLIVFAGSRCRFDPVPSIKSYLLNARDNLLSEGVLEQAEDSLVFKSDYVFLNPSRAAGVVLGREANGWNEWKYSDGRSLDLVHRQNEG